MADSFNVFLYSFILVALIAVFAIPGTPTVKYKNYTVGAVTYKCNEKLSFDVVNKECFFKEKALIVK
jgi:hypothetical protein